MRLCKYCGETKEISAFTVYNGKPTHRCRTCGYASVKAWRTRNPEKQKEQARRHNLKKLYGVSSADYERMFTEQGGVCYICSSPPTRKHLDIDHCHASGKVRRLLCNACNKALGLLNDDLDRVTKLADYLAENLR
jgi:hypothetical protein